MNLVAPSGAIRTPGAEDYIPDWVEAEPIEYLAGVTLDLVHEPAALRTGLIAHSLQYCEHYALPVTSLDGRTRMPPQPKQAWNHPDIIPSAE